MHLQFAEPFFVDMRWLKDILVDLVVTIVITIAVITDWDVARWAVIIYTPIMLLLKLIAVVAGRSTRQLKLREAGAPDWAYHFLYAVNVVLLLTATWWITAAEWLAIWILSFIQQRMQKVPASGT